jgi:uncharacterized protein (TIGR02246 family)
MTIEEAWTLVKKQAHAWENADIAAIPGDFAPDGWFISPGGRWQGHDAIRDAAREFFTIAGEVQVKVTRVMISGNVGAAEWTWSETRIATGTRHTAEDAIIFVMRGSQIIYWREYFDTAQMTSPVSPS